MVNISRFNPNKRLSNCLTHREVQTQNFKQSIFPTVSKLVTSNVFLYMPYYLFIYFFNLLEIDYAEKQTKEIFQNALICLRSVIKINLYFYFKFKTSNFKIKIALF